MCVVLWTSELDTVHPCWADRLAPLGHHYDCGMPAATDIGLCKHHYREIFGQEQREPLSGNSERQENAGRYSDYVSRLTT